ncbi:hypothetical protein CSPX01_15798 [Colletotrichum filicis]|nr:hypothetical protein CSPX01_15798 [Colletotrichum filicis]
MENAITTNTIARTCWLVPLSNCCARSGEQSSKDSGIKGTTPATSFLPDTSSSSPTKCYDRQGYCCTANKGTACSGARGAKRRTYAHIASSVISTNKATKH